MATFFDVIGLKHQMSSFSNYITLTLQICSQEQICKCFPPLRCYFPPPLLWWCCFSLFWCGVIPPSLFCVVLLFSLVVCGVLLFSFLQLRAGAALLPVVLSSWCCLAPPLFGLVLLSHSFNWWCFPVSRRKPFEVNSVTESAQTHIAPTSSQEEEEKTAPKRQRHPQGKMERAATPNKSQGDHHFT